MSEQAHAWLEPFGITSYVLLAITITAGLIVCGLLRKYVCDNRNVLLEISRLKEELASPEYAEQQLAHMTAAIARHKNHPSAHEIRLISAKAQTALYASMAARSQALVDTLTDKLCQNMERYVTVAPSGYVLIVNRTREQLQSAQSLLSDIKALLDDAVITQERFEKLFDETD